MPKTSHKAKSSEKWLQDNLLDFFTKKLARVVTESQLHFDQLHIHMNLVKFKIRLAKIWDEMLQLRRQGIIKEKGERFELN
jgi:hypothetical protein